MKVEHRQAVQVLKSCYGLVNAPYQWFCEVRDRIVSLGGQTLITEPCCWRIKNEEGVVIGLVGSHVDDFYMVGDERDDTWSKFLPDFKDSYRWSPWEADGFDHCGIYMQQLSNREITMDHSKYCSGITQISFEDRDVRDKATMEEVEQARAVLGAIQWRVQQSGPQHGAKLGQLMTLREQTCPRGVFSADALPEVPEPWVHCRRDHAGVLDGRCIGEPCRWWKHWRVCGGFDGPGDGAGPEGASHAGQLEVHEAEESGPEFPCG